VRGLARGSVGLFLVTAALPFASRVAGQERVFKTFDQEQGLTAPPVWALAQDSVGFIWIGAEGGLFRFDGTEIQRWGAEVIQEPVMDIAVSPGGRIAAMDIAGHLYEVRETSAQRLEIPWRRQDSPRRSGGMIAYDAAGALWVRYGDAVGVRAPGGWTTFGPEAFGGERPNRLYGTPFGGAFVVTGTRLWRVDSSLPPTRLFASNPADREVIVGVVEPEAGRALLLLNVGRTQTPRVVEVGAGPPREVVTSQPLPESRAISIRERNGTLWLALDRFLAAVRPGEPPELLGPEDGFESGGPLLVDREGSLWLGSFVGVHQYPEPDTRIWAERQGIRSRHTRFLAASGETLWVLTWNGPSTLRPLGSGWQATSPEWDTRSGICTDAEGRAWTASDDAILEIRGDSVIEWSGLPVPMRGCAPSTSGGVWLGTPGPLVYLDPTTRSKRVFDPPAPSRSADPRPALLHDSQDRLWVGVEESLCFASGTRLLDEGAAPWSCEVVASPSGIQRMVEVDEGVLWVATGTAGLLEFDGRQWQRITIAGAPTQTVHAVASSPRGGAWILGDGILARVRPDGIGGLEVLERLSRWHGVSMPTAGDLWEEPTGDLWIATNYGVVNVPSSVRFEDPPPPPVALVDGRVDGLRLSLDRPLRLPHDRNRLELRFAALSFRDRSGLRHQVRLAPNESWSESTGEPSFLWADLPPGTYQAEYRASRDGIHWSAAPAAFDFEVEPPWYSSAWFLLLVASSLLSLGVSIYRARVGYLVDLEQQRTRIAMDLHDQVGSGLASVGILSSVIASDRLDPSERRRTAREIAGVAEELGHSLSDIVWALDPQTSTMEELATRLTEHGERLFADDAVAFHTRLPNVWPPSRSSVAVRRSVLLIGIEALHNAARHARPSHVLLSMTPTEERAWELMIRDDGTGIRHRTGVDDAGTGPSRMRQGRGLTGMARRAEAIGAVLTIDSSAGHGTEVTLAFHPDGRGPHTWRHRLSRMRQRARMIMRGRNDP
jgi:hypothetical protein